MFVTNLNCSNKFFGRNDIGVYLVVVTSFEQKSLFLFASRSFMIIVGYTVFFLIFDRHQPIQFEQPNNFSKSRKLVINILTNLVVYRKRETQKKKQLLIAI